MGTPDPALGFNVAFPTDLFNNGIRFAMQMGMPVDPDKRPKFVFPSIGKTYWRDGEQVPTPVVDQDDRPLDPEIEMRMATPRTESVDCAWVVERAGSPGEGPVGNFPQTRMVVTLLESDWAKVVGCSSVEYNGDVYIYDYEPENYGLFDAGVHTMIFISEDET